MSWMTSESIGGRASLSEWTAPYSARCTQRPSARVAWLSGFCRPGPGSVDRLHGPGKFRDEHRGRREIWLPAALGGAARECDRDAVSGAVRQARHRDRPKSCGALPRAAAAPGGVGDVGGQRDRRDGNRPRRISRRRDRALLAVQDTLAARYDRYRDRRLRPAATAEKRLPSARTPDRQLGGHDWPLLPDRAFYCAGRLGLGWHSIRWCRNSAGPRR